MSDYAHAQTRQRVTDNYEAEIHRLRGELDAARLAAVCNHPEVADLLGELDTLRQIVTDLAALPKQLSHILGRGLAAFRTAARHADSELSAALAWELSDEAQTYVQEARRWLVAVLEGVSDEG